MPSRNNQERRDTLKSLAFGCQMLTYTANIHNRLSQKTTVDELVRLLYIVNVFSICNVHVNRKRMRLMRLNDVRGQSTFIRLAPTP